MECQITKDNLGPGLVGTARHNGNDTVYSDTVRTKNYSTVQVVADSTFPCSKELFILFSMRTNI